MVMLCFLFSLWLLLNGRITLEICLIGVVLVGAVYAFCIHALDYRPHFERRLLRKAALYVTYTFVLIWEILKANFGVMRIILTPKPDYHPAIVRVHVPLCKEISRVFLSNSITLTPGTVTVEEKDGSFLVLCLDKSNADTIADWNLVHILKKLEDTPWN